MFKLIKTTLSVVLLILLVLWLRKESLIENWISDQLDAQVSIGKVSIRNYGLKIRHLCIHNPSYFDDCNYALETDFITARISLAKLIFSKKIEISHLDIQGPSFNVIISEKNGYTSNWSKFLHKNYGVSSKNFDLIVKKCYIRGARFRIFKPNGKELPLVTLPLLEFYSKNIVNSPPSFSQTFSSLIYLTFESGLAKLHLCPYTSSRLAKQSHFLFDVPSKSPTLASYYSDDPNLSPSQNPEEIALFLRELFFK